MKMIFAFMLSCFIFSGTIQAQEWIAMRTNPPVIQMNTMPVISYSNHIITPVPQPMIYQWVPHIIQQPILVEQRYAFFCKRYVWTTQPQIQWTYQLSYINQSYNVH